MPTWLLMALPYVTKAPSLALGLLHLGQAIVTEIAGNDSAIDKATKVAEDLVTHLPEIEQAIVANTPRA